MQKRREFLKLFGASAAAIISLKSDIAFSSENDIHIIKPPKLNLGDTGMYWIVIGTYSQ